MAFKYNNFLAELRESANGSAKHNAIDHLMEGVKLGKYRLGHDGLEIPDLFQGIFGHTPQQFFADQEGVLRSIALQESATGVTMSDFKHVTAGMIMRAVKDAPQTAELIGDRLFSIENSVPRPNSQNVPWVGGPTRWDESIVGETEAYPAVGPRNGYLQWPKQNKRGKTCPISMESMLADKASIIVKSCKNTMDGGLITRNILQLKVALGSTGSWKFGLNDGAVTSYNTYNTSASGPSPLNSLTSTPLTDWTSIDTVLQAYRTMRDPVSGEFLAMPKKIQIVVPMCIFTKALVIKNAITVNTFNAVYASATIRYDGANPLNYVYPGMEIEVISSPYVDEITGATISTYTWFLGDFPEAFMCDRVFGPKYQELGSGSESSFWKDLELILKMSYYECYFPYNPTRVIKVANT